MTAASSNALKGRRKEQSAVQCFLHTVTGNIAVPLPCCLQFPSLMRMHAGNEQPVGQAWLCALAGAGIAGCALALIRQLLRKNIRLFMKLFTSRKLIAAALSVVFAAGTMASAAHGAPLSRKPQDNLIYGSALEPTGLDPALVTDSDSANINYNVYESLLRSKPDSTDYEPCLAQSWTISEDGKTYTFKLREGVKFHDGAPFNAEAVKINIERQLPANRTPNMAYARLIFDDIEEVKVIDEYTVAIILKQSSTPFLSNMSISFAAAMVSPEALKKYNNTLPVPAHTSSLPGRKARI